MTTAQAPKNAMPTVIGNFVTSFRYGSTTISSANSEPHVYGTKKAKQSKTYLRTEVRKKLPLVRSITFFIPVSQEDPHGI